MIRIFTDPSNSAQIVLTPAKFLGGDLFKTYLAASVGAKYDPSRKCQVTVVTKLAGIIERLHAAGFEVDVSPEVRATLTALTAQTSLDITATDARVTSKDAELAARGRALYPFQKHGMAWLSAKYNALLADEMGLGKTVQALMALPEKAPVLVVCPKVGKGVWQREAPLWRPEYRVTVLSGRRSFRWPNHGEMVVINYDVLPKNLDCVPADGTVLVGDEIHATKNPQAQRTKAWRSLTVAVQKVRGRVWGLTGTPLLNRGPELWAVTVSLGLASESFGKWDRFVTLMGAYKDKYGYVWPPVPADPQGVGECLKSVMLRRLRTEVLPELPTKTYNEVTVDITKAAKKLCDTAWEMVTHTAKDRSGPDEGLSIGEVAEARVALAMAKIPTLLEIVEEHEEQNEPLVVFSAHRAPIDELAKREGWAVITGDTPTEERSRIEDAFQRGDLKGVGGTVRAAGVAITLTRAHRIVFVDRDWTPALNEQAEDRVCRISQDRGVIVTDLVGDHALDRRVIEVLTRKRNLIQATVEQGRQMVGAIKIKDVDALITQSSLEKTVSPQVVDKVLAKSANDNGRFLPRNAREEWAARAVVQLAGDDPDRAFTQNGIGFNRLDGDIGHKMASEVQRGIGLTERQWAFMTRFLAKYQGQVGAMPRE
jgi:SWI/SNF-related matrix-associated actin-dependent regulator of chromatin subfamily A-like protein 1